LHTSSHTAPKSKLKRMLREN